MQKKRYHQNKKHCRHFSLYFSFFELKDEDTRKPQICIVASKKGVHKTAVKRNFAKRRLRALLRRFVNSYDLSSSLILKIVANRSILDCSFKELEPIFEKNLKALSL